MPPENPKTQKSQVYCDRSEQNKKLQQRFQEEKALANDSNMGQSDEASDGESDGESDGL
jgi:hypothetical protein